MEIKYVKKEDYYEPNLGSPQNINNPKIGKYGKLKLKYLKEYNKVECSILFMNNQLERYLLDIDKQAKKQIELLIKQFAKQENVNEELKATNQLEWVRKMNNIKNRAEEIIIKEVIYEEL